MMRSIEQLIKKPAVPMEGVLHPEFLGVAQTFSRLLRSYKGGAAVCVYHAGECVVDIWGGNRNRAGSPWLRDTMAPSFSTTKGVASTLIHIMVDRGLLDYDARVAEYWPEFGQAGKQEITLRQILAHQSGLYHIRQMIDHADRMLDWDHMVHAIEQTEPVHEPGERTGYHGLTYGFLVGEILQRVTGRDFSELVQEELVEPLGLDGLYVGVPESELHRAAQLIWPGHGALVRFPSLPARLRWLGDVTHAATNGVRELVSLAGFDLDLGSILDGLAPRGISSFDFDGDDSLRVAIPAANGLFTARSLARMYAMLAGGGELDGRRVISTRTVDRAAERQVRAPGLAVLPFDMRWRLGYHAIATTAGIPPSAFGHFGFGGSGGWADPETGLAVAFIVNCGMGTPFGDTRTARISGAALRSARSRERHNEAARERRHEESRPPVGASAA